MSTSFVNSIMAAMIACFVSILPCAAQQLHTLASETTMVDESLPDIPVGITSFGGAVAGDFLYIYGGHDGEAHQYYKSGQNASLYRLNLKSPKQWEKVNTSTGRQGLAMVSHQEKLYRLGGFEARNVKGEDQDLHSVADFSVFDASKNQWRDLTPMPVPRSSFDAAVVNDTLFVVGGWTIAGDEPTQWCETALSIDLSDPHAQWRELPTPPFVRRALSISYQGNKLYAIGGMKQKGGPTREVAIYDLETKNWSPGPELPGDEAMEGFGNSSFNVGGSLVVSTYGGNVYRLNESGDAWEKIHQLKTGRFFHRLLPYSENEIVLVGGASMESGKIFELEVLPTGE